MGGARIRGRLMWDDGTRAVGAWNATPGRVGDAISRPAVFRLPEVTHEHEAIESRMRPHRLVCVLFMQAGRIQHGEAGQDGVARRYRDSGLRQRSERLTWLAASASGVRAVSSGAVQS